MELVTGHAGSNHISAADMASMYRGILTDDDCVLASGDKLSCTMLDSNTAEIGTGDCFIQAHHCRVDVAEQLTVESGSAGYKRNDLVVVRYTLGDGNVQDVYLAVVKGTATVGTPSDPTLTTGDIDGGAVLAEFALWRIPLDGITVGDPERVMPCIDTLQDQVADVRDFATFREHTITKNYPSGVSGTIKCYSSAGIAIVVFDGFICSSTSWQNGIASGFPKPSSNKWVELLSDTTGAVKAVFTTDGALNIKCTQNGGSNHLVDTIACYPII